MEPYTWNIKPSLFYIIFIKSIFNTLLFIFKKIENVIKLFRFLQFTFLPLNIIKKPFIGIINYNWNTFYSFEKFIIINNIPIFKIGNSNTKILYIHGGGFISGDYMTFRSLCITIYKKMIENGKNIEIWFPNYTLYSNNSDFINNAINEINYIYSLHQFDSVIADSAGGYLALQIKSPKKLLLISPVTDLSCSSKKYYEDDINFNPQLVKKIFKKIFNTTLTINNTLENTQIIIFVSKNELFIEDALQLKNKTNNTTITPTGKKNETKTQL